PAEKKVISERILSTCPEREAYCGPIHKPMKVPPRSMKVIKIGNVTAEPKQQLVKSVCCKPPWSPFASNWLAKGEIVCEIPVSIARVYSTKLPPIVKKVIRATGRNAPMTTVSV